MKKGKTFLTLLGLAGFITAVTLSVSNLMTSHLEEELAKKANTNLERLTDATPKATFTPVARPTLPPSPTPVPTPENTPIPTPTVLRLSLPATGAEVLSDFTDDMPVFQATYGDYRTHTGMDFGGRQNNPVYAASDGIVVKNEFDYEKGYTVELSHEGGYLTRYCNLSGDDMVTLGQEIAQGEQIGTMGDSGIWESHLPCHLHFELEQDGELINPKAYFAASLTSE